MDDYKNLIDMLRWQASAHRLDAETARAAADSIETLRNELCCQCGKYRQAHNGACDGCRWRWGGNHDLQRSGRYP